MFAHWIKIHDQLYILSLSGLGGCAVRIPAIRATCVLSVDVVGADRLFLPYLGSCTNINIHWSRRTPKTPKQLTHPLLRHESKRPAPQSCQGRRSQIPKHLTIKPLALYRGRSGGASTSGAQWQLNYTRTCGDIPPCSSKKGQVRL